MREVRDSRVRRCTRRRPSGQSPIYDSPAPPRCSTALGELTRPPATTPAGPGSYCLKTMPPNVRWEGSTAAAKRHGTRSRSLCRLAARGVRVAAIVHLESGRKAASCHFFVDLFEVATSERFVEDRNDRAGAACAPTPTCTVCAPVMKCVSFRQRQLTTCRDQETHQDTTLRRRQQSPPPISVRRAAPQGSLAASAALRARPCAPLAS